MEDGRPLLPAAHLNHERGHDVPNVRAHRLDPRPRARGRRLAGELRLFPVEGDEDDRARARRLAGEHPRELDEHAHAPAVVVGPRRLGRGVVVRRHHEELRPPRAQDTDHVGSGYPLGVELLEAHLRESRLPELHGHVLRGGARARRAPGMGTEGGESRRVAQRGIAVESGGEEQELEHRRDGL
jgi:hypothetical protein